MQLVRGMSAVAYPEIIGAVKTDAGSASSSSVRYVIGMSRDRTRVYGGAGILGVSPTLAESTDKGATWTDLHTFTGYHVHNILELNDGEALVALDAISVAPVPAPEIWKSSGWASNRATASWAKMTQGNAVNSKYRNWGMNKWSLGPNGIVIISAYGTTVVQATPTTAATVAQLSTDHGATWTNVLQLGTRYTDPALTMHLHGVAYDSYWDRLWAVFGDGVITNTSVDDPAYTYAMILYSDDLGATWTRVRIPADIAAISSGLRFQTVGIVPLPGCILFTGDGRPHGVARIVRKGYRTMGDLHPVMSPTWATTDVFLAQEANQAADGLPVLIGSTQSGGSADNRPLIIGTLDGFDFFELYAETMNVSGAGFFHGPYGPTRDGQIVAMDTNQAGNPYRFVADLNWLDNEPRRLTADYDDGQAGIIAPSSRGWTYSQISMVANRAHFLRFVPSRDMTISSIAFAVTVAATTDDACDVAIYARDKTRLVSKGATTGLLNSTGVKVVSITPTTVRAGKVYYAAFSCGTIGGTQAQLESAGFHTANTELLFGTAFGVIQADVTLSGAHPLPDPCVPAGVGTSQVVVLALRE